MKNEYFVQNVKQNGYFTNVLLVGIQFFFQGAQLELVLKEEKEMLETRSLPLRNYLMQHIMPTLTEGLIEACKIKPDDPVDYIVSIKYLVISYLQRWLQKKFFPFFRLNTCLSITRKWIELNFSVVMHIMTPHFIV